MRYGRRTLTPPCLQLLFPQVLDWDDVPESVRHHFRRRTGKSGAEGPRPPGDNKRKSTCMLYLQADHLFHAQMGSEEATIDSMTRHVQRVNSIYKDVGECHFPLNSACLFVGLFADGRVAQMLRVFSTVIT